MARGEDEQYRRQGEIEDEPVEGCGRLLAQNAGASGEVSGRNDGEDRYTTTLISASMRFGLWKQGAEMGALTRIYF